MAAPLFRRTNLQRALRARPYNSRSTSKFLPTPLNIDFMRYFRQHPVKEKHATMYLLENEHFLPLTFLLSCA